MINKYTFKQMMGILIPCLLTVVLFYYGLLFSGLVGGLVLMIFGLVVGNLIGVKISDNPFQKMLKGQGILVFDINSTGIIQPYNAYIKPPFVYSKINGKYIRSIFNRKNVLNLKMPITPKGKLIMDKDKNGKQFIQFPTLNEDDYMNNRMALISYPIMLFNSATNSFVSKDWLSGKETKTFAENSILYVSKLAEELGTKFDYFARHVVEQLKPKSQVAGKVIIIIIVIILIIAAVVFLPKLLETFSPALKSAGSAIGGNAITPR